MKLRIAISIRGLRGSGGLEKRKREEEGGGLREAMQTFHESEVLELSLRMAPEALRTKRRCNRS